MNDNNTRAREDVITCYRFLLGREPDSEEVVQWHLSRTQARKDLIEHFVSGPEFESRFRIFRTGMYLDAHNQHVDVEATSDEMKKLLDRIAMTWSELGNDEPHWSVITDEAFKRGSIQENLEEFYKTGKREIEQVGALLRRNGLQFNQDATCIDFGCGVGRLSNALADHVGHVIGVDVSDGHLRGAREYVSGRFGKMNCQFTQISCVDDIDTLPRCDLLVTLIVLQHNPPPVMYAMLRKLLGRLSPGGAAVFQVPTYRHEYAFSVSDYLTSPRSQDMEMHPLPSRYVFKAIEDADCSVLEVREDLLAHMRGVISQTFLVQKAG